MSDGPTLPLFYHRIVGVNPELHGQQRLDREGGYGFAAGARSVPLGLGEFESAAQYYPILFTAGANPTPVALLALDDEGNLFLDQDGAWRSGCYVPACLRAYPFILLEDEAAGKTIVGMEADAACLQTGRGARLFEDGAPTATLNEAVAFCSSWRDNFAASATFARALDEAGILTEEEATVHFTAGGGARLGGFKLVRPEKLDAVPDDLFLDWRRRGWLGALYAHLNSTAQWSRLIDLTASRQASRQSAPVLASPDAGAGDRQSGQSSPPTGEHMPHNPDPGELHESPQTKP